MKKSLLFLLAFNCAINAFSQTDIYALMERTDISITEAVRIADLHFQQVGMGRVSGYKQFQLWL